MVLIEAAEPFCIASADGSRAIMGRGDIIRDMDIHICFLPIPELGRHEGESFGTQRQAMVERDQVWTMNA